MRKKRKKKENLRKKKHLLSSSFSARIISEVEVSLLAPSTSFFKKWKVRNEGVCHWPLGTKLVYAGKEEVNRMGEKDSFPLPHEVGEREELELSLPLLSPAIRGAYEGKWRLTLPDGVKFGPLFVVKIFVADQLN
eukprot:TRINITY_DN9699_c0_g1_i1.p2 TRINITY_DN9699_c0_g1~~TRINITY_DN9699_c0_g1_i1.p2  ORF type:complete len:135 (-),score=49.56 TRINITY_DN9699_c0_g1_i1:106-510(-)